MLKAFHEYETEIEHEHEYEHLKNEHYDISSSIHISGFYIAVLGPYHLRDFPIVSGKNIFEFSVYMFHWQVAQIILLFEDKVILVSLPTSP